MLLHQRYWDTVKLGGLMVLAILCCPLFVVGLPIRVFRQWKARKAADPRVWL